MGKVIRVKKGNQEFDVEEGKLQLALNDGFTPVKEEKVLTVVKGDKEFQVKESNLSAAMADGFKKKDATTPSQNGGEETSVTASETPSIKYEYNPLSTDQFNQPVIQTENGTSLSVNPKSIPVTPAINQKQYLQDVQQRIKTGTKTLQDETFIDNVKKANNVFGIDENETLTSFANKYDPQGQQIANLPIPDAISMFSPSLKGKTFGEAFDSPDGKLAIVGELEKKIREKYNSQVITTGSTLGVQTSPKMDDETQSDLQKLAYLKNTLTTEKQKTDTYPIFNDVAVRTDESGNLLKKALSRVAATNPLSSAAGVASISNETQDRIEKQPVEFSLGLNGLKYREPAQYERVMAMLNNGTPLSESMIANITAQGLDDKEAILKDQLTKGDINQQQFIEENKKVQKTRYDNIVNNKETLRAFISNGIANLADDVEQEKDKDNNNISGKIWGNRWNYTDEEIANYGTAYAKANGINPDDARVKDAIKYLQDNEGALILENSIAKAGYVRDLAKGLAQPVRGISSTIEDVGKSNADIYTESQSQGNVNVSEDRVSRIKSNPIENAVSDVLEGTGQFLTQAGLAAATSGALGIAGESLAASGLGATTAGETIGTAANIGNKLLSSKDAIATVVTAYAQSYDSNLKQALSYTADDGKAKLTANIMSGLEGATELFLSPLEIAQGIGNKLFNKKKISQGIIGVLNDAAIVDKNAAIKNFLKASAKGALETGKVALAEIGEEEVTQIADYVSNAMLNSDSKSFKNRDLANEMVNTAYQTGLSMALPALVSGVGAYNVNNFSKGSLLIASQNRQHLIDDMNQRLHNGEMSQDEYNQKATIINTAASANQLLPIKDNGKKLNTEEKANYVYSRVSEAVLSRQLQLLKEDKSRDVGKIGEGEDATKVEDPEITQLKKKIEKQIEYRAALLQSKGVYVVNGERVDKAQLNEIIKTGDLGKYDISISNDDKLQNKVDELRKPKEPIVKPEVVAEETKIEVPVEGLGEFQEEAIVAPKEEPLKANLQAAREQAAALPLEQQQKPIAEVAPLQSNLEAARQQGVVEESAATLADERAKQLLGENAPQTTVAPKEQNLEAVRNQQVQKDLEEQQLANVANVRVAQMALDKIPMTDAASKALAKMDKVKGKKLGAYREIAKQNPKGFLKEVAQQARGILASGVKDVKAAMKEVVKNYTQDVVDEALAMFPEESKVIQNEPIKEVKSSTTVSSDTKGIIDEISGKKLTHVSSKGMGAKQADGIYISTETGNRYATKDNPANGVSVEIKNPKVSNFTENLKLQHDKLNDLVNEGLTRDDISTEYWSELPDGKNVSKWYRSKFGDKINDDVFSEKARAKAAKKITQQYKNEGHDALYLPETPNTEGELIVFDRNNVTFKNTNQNETTKSTESIGTRQNESGKNNPSKPAKEKTLTEKVNAIEDVFDPYDRALQHFAGDGKIHPSEIVRLFGNKGDKSSRISLIKNDAPTVKQLAHSLWESDDTGKYDDQDYINAIERVLTDFNSKVAMQKDLVERYDFESAAQKYYEDYQTPEAQQAIDIVSDLTDDDINHILELEADKTKEKELDDYIQQVSESNQLPQKTLPKIETTERDNKLFSDIASALSVVGQKNKEAAIESLHSGKKAKYSKEEVDAAIAINKDFEKIVADMQKDELLSKECKT